MGAALTGGYAYFHSDYYHEFEAARRREREEEGAKRVAEVRRMESERYARQQREIERDHRKRALESARLDTYEDPATATTEFLKKLCLNRTQDSCSVHIVVRPRLVCHTLG